VPSPLHKIPDALLGAFNLKTNGQAPNQFGDVVLPTGELLDFYLRDFLRISNIAGTVQNPGDAVSLTVPAGEMWRLLGVGVAIQPVPADAAIGPYGRFDVRYEIATVPSYIIATAGPAMGAVARNISHGFMLPVPLLCKASTVIAWRNETAFSAAAAVNLNMQYQAIPL